jgi:hypothetical protein
VTVGAGVVVSVGVDDGDGLSVGPGVGEALTQAGSSGVAIQSTACAEGPKNRAADAMTSVAQIVRVFTLMSVRIFFSFSVGGRCRAGDGGLWRPGRDIFMTRPACPIQLVLRV